MSDSPQEPAATSVAAAEGARRLLTLARSDRRAATAAFASLSVDAQVALVCETPLGLRTRLLSLADDVSQIVPRLPEAELCFTVKSAGVEDSSWLIAHATPAQVTACFDLDAWQGLEPDRKSIDGWMATLAEAGEDALRSAARTLDPELLVLHLRNHIDVVMDPKDEEWQAPPGAQTIDGQFYLIPKRSDDDIATVLALVNSIFQTDYWLYFRLVQACIWELDTELEEWALRWRSGRLEDLGFPSWDESMRIYGHLPPARRDELDAEASPVTSERWNLPVWLPNLPARVLESHSLFRAIAELSDEERVASFYSFVSLANKVAVAEKLPLGDPETLPKSIDLAAATASRGLEWLGSKHDMAPSEVLRRASLDRLFRVGASLARGDGDTRIIPPPPGAGGSSSGSGS